MEFVEYLLKDRRLCHVECLGRDAQWGLEGPSRGCWPLATMGPGSAGDAALMWRHVESVRPVADREGAQAMENLLAATTGPGGQGCRLTEFSEAYRKGTPYPDMREGELEAVKRWTTPAIDALDNGGAGPVGGGR